MLSNLRRGSHAKARPRMDTLTPCHPAKRGTKTPDTLTPLRFDSQKSKCWLMVSFSPANIRKPIAFALIAEIMDGVPNF